MATKAETQIETDIYKIVKESELASLINGTVYRRGQRPKNATTEDCVVTFVSGLDGQTQTGVVNVNIYVPMRQSDLGTNKVEDLARVKKLEIAIIELTDNGDLSGNEEYVFERKATPSTTNIDDIEQTCICTQLSYKRASFIDDEDEE